MTSTSSRSGKKSRSSTLSPSLNSSDVKMVQTVNPANENDEKSLISMLEDYGYLWNRGIYVGEADSATLLFAKVSILGHKVYVEIDDYAQIRPNSKDLSITQMMKVKKEVVSEPIYMDDCATLDVSGTAYECSGGFCTLRRDMESLDVIEEDFYIKTERQSSIAFEKDPSQGKPIVKLSEIKENNGLVLQNIVRASNRLSSNAQKQYYLSRMDMGAALGDLHLKFSAIQAKTDDIYLMLSKNIALANSKVSDIMIPPQENEKLEYFSQMKHLETVHSTKRRFFKEMSYLSVITAEIDRLHDELDIMLKDMNNY